MGRLVTKVSKTFRVNAFWRGGGYPRLLLDREPLASSAQLSMRGEIKFPLFADAHTLTLASTQTRQHGALIPARLKATDVSGLQRSLFPEDRKRKPPPAIERRTHIAVADLLRRLIRPGWLWMHVPNGEMRTKKTGALLKRMGVLPGTLDFLLIDPMGKHYWLELKRDRLGRPSPAQLAFMQQLELRRVPYAVAYTFDGAVDQLRAWDALKPFTRQ